ncbi:membrane progestin receptor beta-like [Osmerus mordax]|uniref:membrane progestin receptor beta-like n=1 Tax=Osmerus mordax TaxID=8014 RepID=UPI0035109E5C
MPRVTFSCPTALSLNTLVHLLPSLPPTMPYTSVPSLFWEPYILSGYRPPGLPWRYYLLSLLQVHNETVNVWSHLLAGVFVALRVVLFSVMRGGGLLGVRLSGPEGWGLGVDLSSLPLALYLFSSLTYLLCSAATHLLHSHSDSAHLSFYFLDSVGMAVYQYGCAMVLYFYSSTPTWQHSGVAEVFLPSAALLAWLSCASCCFSKLRYLCPYPLSRKLCQLVPTGLAYLLVFSPVAHRIANQLWGYTFALPLHCLQGMLFLLAAFFFFFPIPECCFPGRCDIIGHAHQIFHLLLCLSTLAQQEAVLEDFLSRRASLVKEHGEWYLLVAGVSFPLLVLLCSMTAIAMRTQAHTHLMLRRGRGGGEDDHEGGTGAHMRQMRMDQ